MEMKNIVEQPELLDTWIFTTFFVFWNSLYLKSSFSLHIVLHVPSL